MKTNRRAAERLESMGLMTHLFDGRSAVLGVVEDVSPGGLRVSTIPAVFAESVPTCYAVVNGAWQDFHLALHPRWVVSAPRGMYKMIGFQIEQPSVEWTHFIETMGHEQAAGMGIAA